MNGPEWDKQRERAILAVFQTGRPVFTDSDGQLRYTDGAGEPVAEDVGFPGRIFPRLQLSGTSPVPPGGRACVGGGEEAREA